MKYRIIDWKEPILETLAIVIFSYLAYRIHLADKIITLLENNITEINDILYLQLAYYGNAFIALCVMFILLFHIRSSNKEKKLNQSGNKYHNHSYFGYWFCSKILGYQTCCLVRVPIPMQFRLLINGTFHNFDLGGDDDYDKREHEDIIVKLPDGEYTKIINLILVDTYPITEGMISASSAALSTVYISRNESNDRTRCISNEFVNCVRNTVQKLPNNVTGINLYSTLNPKHCRMIANSIFRCGGRSNITLLKVFPQKFKNGSWNFEEEGININLE